MSQVSCQFRKSAITLLSLKSVDLFNRIFGFMCPCIVKLQHKHGKLRFSTREWNRSLMMWYVKVFGICGIIGMGTALLSILHLAITGPSRLSPWIEWTSYQTVFLFLDVFLLILVFVFYTGMIASPDAWQIFNILQQVEDDCD